MALMCSMSMTRKILIIFHFRTPQARTCGLAKRVSAASWVPAQAIAFESEAQPSCPSLTQGAPRRLT